MTITSYNTDQHLTTCHHQVLKATPRVADIHLLSVLRGCRVFFRTRLFHDPVPGDSLLL